MIYRKLPGKFLIVDIEQPKREEGIRKTESGIFMPDSVKETKGFRKATVIQPSDELKEEYKKGDKLHIVPVGREKEYKYDDLHYWIIPEQDVIGVL